MWKIREIVGRLDFLIQRWVHGPDFPYPDEQGYPYSAWNNRMVHFDACRLADG